MDLVPLGAFGNIFPLRLEPLRLLKGAIGGTVLTPHFPWKDRQTLICPLDLFGNLGFNPLWGFWMVLGFAI